MRRILVEQARRKQTAKRGGDLQRRSTSMLRCLEAPEPATDLLALDEALDELAAGRCRRRRDWSSSASSPG